jgi:nucleotide-binding universal stress UspA family protein
MLAKVVPAGPAIGYEHRLLAGDPAHAILQCAAKESVDLIVMSTHGRTGFSRLLMGSIAEAVVREAKCPVLTLKQPAVEAVAK